MKKLVMMLSLVLALSAMFIGCSSKKTEDVANEPKKEVENSKPDTSKPEEIVTLKWITLGNGMPSNYDAWQKNINAYLEEKIGVHIDVEVVSWGDWGNRRNVLVNSGEYFDILFTDSGKFTSDIAIGAYYDIKDLVKTSSPDLYKYIPESYWDAVTINGSVYAVPTYKDSSLSNYILWDKNMVDKYDVDYLNINTFDEMTDSLRKIKEGENMSPFLVSKGGVSSVVSLYDGLGAELTALGVKYDDETRTVVNVFEQEDTLNQLNTLHQWYKEGIINADAATIEFTANYNPVSIAQGWPSAAVTTWGPNMGTEVVVNQINETILTNGTVQGSLNAIYAGSKYPEKSLELLQLFNLDSYVRDALYYGLEGDNFKYTEDGKIDKLNTDWSMAGYTQGTFFTITQLVDTEFNQWDEVKALNESAIPSVLLGFTMNDENIQNELANCREVVEKYRSELMTGVADPAVLVPTMTKELNAAGFEKIMKEAQDQVNAYYNK